MSNLHRESSIGASYQVLVHLGRFKCEHLTEGEHNVMSKVHLAFWTGELNKKSAYSLEDYICIYNFISWNEHAFDQITSKKICVYNKYLQISRLSKKSVHIHCSWFHKH